MTTTITPIRQPGNAVDPAATPVNSLLDSSFVTWSAVFLLLFLVCSVAEDLRLRMWNDEIVTLYVARQGSPSEIVKATREGMDATPPLYPMLVSAILPIVRPDALAVRLPSTLGFAAMLLCVLLFCRRRMPAIYGFIAALLTALACSFYATEGRCYGMVLGCAAGALVCWQAAAERTPRAPWLTMLALCLALATALHYYSLFLLVPLALAEFVRWRRSRKPDFAVLGAMLPALVVLALHYPLIAAGRKYLSHFWTPGAVSWRQVPQFYLEFGLFAAGVILVGFIALAMTSGAPAEQSVRRPVLPRYEWVAVVTLALMPVLVIAISSFTTHIFLARYTLWAAIGVAVASTWLLWITSCRQPLAGTLVLGALLLIVAAGQFRSLREPPLLRQGETVRRELQFVPEGTQPIVVGYDHAFMELSYYAEPRLRARLVYPLSRSLELRYNGSDLDYLLLSAVRRRTQLHIVELDEFLKANHAFILASVPKDYLPQYLATAGYRLVAINPEAAPGLYEVEAP